MLGGGLLDVVFVACLAGLVQGMSGFAFGLVATTLWAWTMEPRELVPMVVVGSLIGQIASIRHVRTSINASRVMPFLIGGAIGTPIGVAVLDAIDVDVFRTAVGIGLVAYCSLMLTISVLPKVSFGGRIADGSIGAVAGVMGGASGLSGPPMIIWCALRGWVGAEQRATYQTYFISMQVLMLALLSWRGMLDPSMLAKVAVVAPAVVFSSLVGAGLSARFSEQQFRRVLFSLLWISGIVLMAPLGLSMASSIGW